MHRGKRIALVIPAYNEAKLIRPTLEAVPGLIDKIYVVDDASPDNQSEVIRDLAKKDKRIELIRHEENQGPGGAIISGYLRSSKDNYDITVVIGGDHQMNLDEVERFLDPLIDGKADYTKGNRFFIWHKTRDKMPRIRIVGNIIITALTKLASGYYKIMDVVDGYTAITKQAIDIIDWGKAYKRYGYPMDFLIRLNAYGFRVLDVARTPVYLEGERQSQIKGLKYALRVSPMLLKGFFWRMIFKYIYLDFHPLVFFFFAGMILFPYGLYLGFELIYKEFFIVSGKATGPTAILCALSIITGLQFLLFGMWFDMEMSK
ncbi:MAG TPA: glycosyltransferase family 2 protein [Candidatus Omnitrophota bacterium]|nr:glycosyltransferase family 2 protein [Candidatus Omnitrophota bacterium]